MVVLFMSSGSSYSRKNKEYHQKPEYYVEQENKKRVIEVVCLNHRESFVYLNNQKPVNVLSQALVIILTTQP